MIITNPFATIDPSENDIFASTSSLTRRTGAVDGVGNRGCAIQVPQVRRNGAIVRTTRPGKGIVL